MIGIAIASATASSPTRRCSGGSCGGGGPIRRMTDDRGEDARPSWSPDGRWLYFISNRSGRSEIWRVPRDGGEATQVTRDGAANAKPSRDGQWLYYQGAATAQGAGVAYLAEVLEADDAPVTLVVSGRTGDWATLETLLPKTSLDYFRSPEAEPVLARIRNAGNVVHY